MFSVMVMLFVSGCFKQQTIYVPSRWTTMEYVKEIKYVWFIQSDEIVFDPEHAKELNLIVSRIWEADRNGLTLEQINNAFLSRTLKDILDNGI